MAALSAPSKTKAMQEKEDDPLYWARGRLVAIRPDGARRSFDPEATMVIRTDDERAAAAVALDALCEQVRARQDIRPEWLMTDADASLE